MPVHASVIIVTYNSERWIDSCLSAVQGQQFDGTYETIVVDNSSSDRTPEIVREKYPTVRFIDSENRGFGIANNVAARYAEGDVLAFLNPDTCAAPRWLAAIIEPVVAAEVVTTSKVVLMDDPERINTCGNILHITGFGFVGRYGKQSCNLSENFCVDGISGAAFAMTRADYERLGGFDEDYFMYVEDSDLSWRIRNAGMRVVCATRSTVRHHYHTSMSPEKLCALEKGRVVLLRKHLDLCSWLVFAPSLLLSFVLSLVGSIMMSPLGVISWCHGLCRGLRSEITSRSRGHSVMPLLTPVIPFEQISQNRAMLAVGALVNLIFRVNHWLGCRLLTPSGPRSAPAHEGD